MTTKYEFDFGTSLRSSFEVVLHVCYTGTFTRTATKRCLYISVMMTEKRFRVYQVTAYGIVNWITHSFWNQCCDVREERVTSCSVAFGPGSICSCFELLPATRILRWFQSRSGYWN
jgi:hypothetical protein